MQAAHGGTMPDHTVSTEADNKAGNTDENGHLTTTFVGEGKSAAAPILMTPQGNQPSVQSNLTLLYNY